ncbi:MAG: hypothetical protein J7L26_11015 [Candidatus Aminicenantes bacterium]|nr:hypothetical protein [Candidatus Aminicenantes bacterium]
MKGKVLFLVVFLVVFSSVIRADVIRPVAVSPGSEVQPLVVESACPTFSWGAVTWANSYRIVVYELGDIFEGVLYYEDISPGRTAALDKRIEGEALSWTPSRGERLKEGVEYVWFVGADDGSGNCVWSVGKRFKVELRQSALPERKIKDKVPGRGAGVEAATADPFSNKERGEVLGRLERKKALTKEGSFPPTNKGDTSDYKFIALGSENDGYDNVYYGSGAGANLNIQTRNNAIFGLNAGNSLDEGDLNTFVGNYSGYLTTTGISNTFIGFRSGRNNTSGNYNSFLGCYAGYYNSTANYNVFIGYSSGFYNETGESNVLIGCFAGQNNKEGARNTFVGYDAGHSNNASGNVFLGYKAGYYETGANKLYIANSNTTTPLIYGEFDNALLKVNGTLTVTESNINVETTENRARFRLLAAGGNYFNFTARNDYNDVTLSVWDASGSQWLPMLSYEYYNNKVDFKDNDIVTTGSISKGSGTFDIPHPDPAKKETGWRLRHSFVESPTAGDNLYRYQVKVVGGQAVIKLPEYFKYLNENPQGWVSPVDVLGVARIEVDLEEARIYATVDGTYNVLIIGTRKDETAVRNWEKYGVEYQKTDTGASHKE